jgi:hypothetical protein
MSRTCYQCWGNSGSGARALEAKYRCHTAWKSGGTSAAVVSPPSLSNVNVYTGGSAHASSLKGMASSMVTIQVRCRPPGVGMDSG